MQITVKILKLHSEAQVPHYAHAEDAGLDLCSVEAVQLLPGQAQLVRTGLAIELPPYTEAQVRPRSGLALNHAVTVLNTPGTIDAGYRGEIGVILINHGSTPFAVTQGMRIAQMVITPVIHAAITEVSQLGDSRRGTGGFGSTGL